jgi:hypothetical protein
MQTCQNRNLRIGHRSAHFESMAMPGTHPQGSIAQYHHMLIIIVIRIIIIIIIIIIIVNISIIKNIIIIISLGSFPNQFGLPKIQGLRSWRLKPERFETCCFLKTHAGLRGSFHF